MRRPTRTRRLTIAAVLSLMAFGVVTGAGVRSFWSLDCWENSNGRWGIALAGGCAIFNHHSEFPASYTPIGFYHTDVRPDAFEINRAVGDFTPRE